MSRCMLVPVLSSVPVTVHFRGEHSFAQRCDVAVSLYTIQTHYLFHLCEVCFALIGLHRLRSNLLFLVFGSKRVVVTLLGDQL